MKLENKDDLDWHKSVDHEVKLLDGKHPELIKILDEIDKAHREAMGKLASRIGITTIDNFL